MKKINTIIILLLVLLMASCSHSPVNKDIEPNIKLLEEYSYNYINENNNVFINVMVFDLYTGQYFESDPFIWIPNAREKEGYNICMDSEYMIELISFSYNLNYIILEPFMHYEIRVYFMYETEEEIKTDDNLIIVMFDNYDEDIIYDERNE